MTPDLKALEAKADRSAEKVAQAQADLERKEADLASLDRNGATGGERAAREGSVRNALDVLDDREHEHRANTEALQEAWKEAVANQVDPSQASELGNSQAALKAGIGGLDDIRAALVQSEATRGANIRALRTVGNSPRIVSSPIGYSVDGKQVRSIVNPAISDLLRALIPILRLSDSYGAVADNLAQLTRFTPGLLPKSPESDNP